MNSCFDKICEGNCTLYIHRNFRNDAFEQTLMDGEKKLCERYQLTIVKSSDTARVYNFTTKFDDTTKGVYFKQHLCRSAWDFIKHFVRANRAERAFNATEMLRENGFDIPVIIAIGKFRYGLNRTTSFLVTLEIEDAKQIRQFIFNSTLTIQTRRELIRAFGRSIGRMHANGIFHGDLRLGNILARREKDHWSFFFLDNERTRKFHRLPARLRLKNLVQINMPPPALISYTDRMRFFREYLAQNEKSKINKKMLIHKVYKKTSKRLKKSKNQSR